MMQLDNNPDQPQTVNGEAAADIRMLFEVNIADIRDSKAQEWRITFQVFLLYGAFVAADRLLPDIYDWPVTVATLFAGLAAIAVLWTYRRTIVRRRHTLRELERRLRVTSPHRPMTPWHDWWIPSLLTALVFVGMAAATLLVLLPETAAPAPAAAAPPPP